MSNGIRNWWVVDSILGDIRRVEGYVDSEGWLHVGNGVQEHMVMPGFFCELEADALASLVSLTPRMHGTCVRKVTNKLMKYLTPR